MATNPQPTKKSDKVKFLSELKHTTALTSPDVAPVVDAQMTHGIERESNVDIMFMLAPEEYIGQPERDRRLIRVKVWSKVKPSLFRFSDIKCAGKNEQEMLSACGMVAGILAEQLQALYADTVEPSECARDAGRHFRELVEHLRRNGQ